MSDCAPSLSRDGAKSHKIRGSTRRGGRIPGANWPQSLGGYEQGIEFCESARSPHALEVRDLCAFCARGVEQGGSSRVLRGLFVDFRGGRQVCVVAEFVAMAAAGLIKNLRVTKTGAGSRSLAESQQRAKDFFREACRALPPIMDRYNLDDVITLSELRTKVASEFRKHHHNTNPKVIDMLVFKGREELQYCIDHSKQRHHLLSQYIIGREGLAGDIMKLGEAFKGESDFLKNFYRGNN